MSLIDPERLRVEIGPEVRCIAGDHHYVHYDSHGEQLAGRLQGGGFNLPANATVYGVGGLLQDVHPRPNYLESEDLVLLDKENGYTLDDRSDISVVVQIDRVALHKPLDDLRFSPEGVIIVPQNEPLPLLDGHDNDHILYKLLGFFDLYTNQLITWNGDRDTELAIIHLVSMPLA